MASAHCVRSYSHTDYGRPMKPFSLQSRTFALGRKIWADKFLGIWGIFGQTIGTQWCSESLVDVFYHGLRMPSEEITFTAWPKIKSQSQIYSYSRSIFYLPHWPKISGFFDLCVYWVSRVHVFHYSTIISTKK